MKVAAGNIDALTDPTYLGEVLDDTTFSYVCALDEGDDPLTDAREMITTVTAPTIRAVTLEEARQQLRLDAHDEDMLLAAHLYAAQTELERLADLRLCEQTLAMVLEEWPDEITVPVRPVTIAAITYIDNAGTTIILPEADYVARARHGFMRIRPATGKSWPELGPDGHITITLSAGFSEGHPDLAIARAAILVKTASLFENREGATCLAFDTLVNQLAARWV